MAEEHGRRRAPEGQGARQAEAVSSIRPVCVEGMANCKDYRDARGEFWPDLSGQVPGHGSHQEGNQSPGETILTAREDREPRTIKSKNRNMTRYILSLVSRWSLPCQTSVEKRLAALREADHDLERMMARRV